MISASPVVDGDGAQREKEAAIDQGVDVGEKDEVTHVFLPAFEKLFESKAGEADDVQMLFLLAEPCQGYGVVQGTERVPAREGDAGGIPAVFFDDFFDFRKRDVRPLFERPCRRILAKRTVVDAPLEEDDDTDAWSVDDGFFGKAGKSHVFYLKSLRWAGLLFG